MFCPSCGANTASQSAFCPSCGEKFPPGAAEFASAHPATDVPKPQRKRGCLWWFGVTAGAVVALAIAGTAFFVGLIYWSDHNRVAVPERVGVDPSGNATDEPSRKAWRFDQIRRKEGQAYTESGLPMTIVESAEAGGAGAHGLGDPTK